MPITDTSGGDLPPRRQTGIDVEAEAAQAMQKRGRRILQEAMWRGVPPLSLGPGGYYQQVFDQVACCGAFAPWDRVAIYGTAAALASGHTVEDCRAELATWWPGNSRRIELLIQHGRAQALVERVRRAREVRRGHRAHTRAGVALMAVVLAAGLDDKAARQAVMADWRSSLSAVAMDPVFWVRGSPSP